MRVEAKRPRPRVENLLAKLKEAADKVSKTLGRTYPRVRVLHEDYTVLTWLFGRTANKSQLKKATEYSFFLGRLSFRVEMRKLYKPTTW